MKKQIILTIAIVFISLILGSCKDNKTDFLEDFSTILYFKNSGELPLTLYKTGEDTDYKIIINKAGSKLDAVSKAGVSIMTAAELENYNSEEGSSYKALPQDCYAFSGETNLNFKSEDLYQFVTLSLKTDKIEQIINADTESTYVLPIILVNSQDSINAEKNKILLQPKVVTPSLNLKKRGYAYHSFPDNEEEMTYSLPVAISMGSLWDFDCTIELDVELLSEYNSTNGTNYILLPESSYELSKKVIFTPNGATEGNFIFKVKKTELSYNKYVLPLKLTSVSKPEFIISEQANSCLFGVSYVPDAGKLRPVTLTDAIVSSNSHAAEGSIANMFDGDINTYFHSDYSGSVPTPHYLQIDLTEEKSVFSFSFNARSTGGAGTPAQMTLQTSMDGITFNTVEVLKEGFPPGAGALYNSPIILGPKFKHIRLVIDQNQAGGSYFVFSEFKLNVL